MMSINTTLQQLKQQVTQLPPADQLELVSYICEQLNSAFLDSKTPAMKDDAALHQMEAEKLLALCDAAAEMWEGEFDAAEEIRRMRQERDEQIWASR
jgi:hypothetical protein